MGTVPSTIIRNITALSSQIAYSDRIKENITVLTTKSAGNANGLLYVPDLEADDPCSKQAASYVPASAVRRAQLPPTNYNLVALAPWISSSCSKRYMSSARTDPLRAFIFYRPTNSSAPPPHAASHFWDLNGGSKWKTQSSFPVYAVSGLVGHQMMVQLSRYSGNLSEVPFGSNIAAIYEPHPNDYVRIWTDIAVSVPPSLPGIWIYFLIIAGVLFAVVSSTSLSMHLAQARRRASLRRRVTAGEVNLEGMGISRVRVPATQIRKFPLYTYHYEPEGSSPPMSPRSPTSPRSPRRTRTRRHSRSASENPSVANLAGSEKGITGPYATSTIATDYQPLCLICLEPYQNRVTVIRELPCRHIFHPDCIDEFLGENSSLCPVCKACMLPQGYCPKITNAMARRERALRRLRDEVLVDEDGDEETKPRRRDGIGKAIKKRLYSKTTTDDTITGPTASTALRNTPPSQTETEEPPELSRGVQRARMRELAGSNLEDAETSWTRWQRIKNNVFPGF